MDFTSMLNNQSSVDFLNYSDLYPLFDWHNVIYIYYEKIGTDNFYWAELSVDTEKQYTWPEDVIKYGTDVPKSYFLDRLQEFYNAVIK